MPKPRSCAGEAFAVLVAVSQQSNVKLRDPDAERAVRAAFCEHMR
ncbi:hypothetical protein [Amycolatopsis sp. NPDC051102]